ncbi:MAG: hypothetical protein HKO65_00645 [Gemmatimonadetes bacterium]|nr:PD40 domain-containing protein [Gemmatimonadota bacterium]NNM03580.1 hypothetical protein [Gemmatimonadota bacterium]
MSFPGLSTKFIPGTLALTACLAVASCDCAEWLGPADPATVIVSLSTTGMDMPTTLLLTVTSTDGSAQHNASVPANGNTTLGNVTAEVSVTVTIGEVPANCSVTGQNPQTVVTQSGIVTTLTFQVTCEALLGDIQVATVTTGTELPEGYSLEINDAPSGAIGLSDTKSFTGLPVGSHWVELRAQDGSALSGVCTLAGENPRSISVTYGQTTSTTFQITCPVLLTVETQTSGTVPDPDGYLLQIDAADAGAIAVNQTRGFDLMPGDHTVELTGVDPSCVVAGDNPRTVTLPLSTPGATVFEVTCPVGLQVRTVTTGANLDPDGYHLTIDAGAPVDIGINATQNYTLMPGDHELELSLVAGNCTVSPDNPRTVTLPTDSDIETVFNVTCEGTGGGTLRIETATTGWDLPNTYMFSFDGVPQGTIQKTGWFENTTAEAGDHTVELTNVPANCYVQEGNPQTVTVPDGGTGTAQFTIACGGILFESNPMGHRDILVGHSDGSPGFTRLTSSPGVDQDPAWHPSRTKIAYTCDHGVVGWGICIRDVTANMADPPTTVLLGDLFNDTDPEWSPDGTKIAFKSDRAGNPGRDIWVINADGTNPVNVTNSAFDDEDPSWHPDGTRLVFHSDRNLGENDVFLINIDGSGLVNLTNNPLNDDEDGVFSPDGTKIVFMSERGAGGDEEIWVMNADGSGKVQLTFNSVDDDDPNWSPDGTMISWTQEQDSFGLDDEIMTMNVDGSSQGNFTLLSTKDDESNWK